MFNIHNPYKSIYTHAHIKNPDLAHPILAPFGSERKKLLLPFNSERKKLLKGKIHLPIESLRPISSFIEFDAQART